ncbi:Hypp6662 [Branchiostoma lanceolatum]|uniref:Hypp6662 protein n=1 Tax=Branchiostoma lanceolatum TaxID=7740 RepID=A0A8K0EB09_BRALA|nr:Hypp6662 [Branchiostoma lanceolatum]
MREALEEGRRGAGGAASEKVKDLTRRSSAPTRDSPSHCFKFNSHRVNDGVDVELDRKGQPPPATPATGRGYRHQTEDAKDLVQWCVHFQGPGHNLGCLVA